jgi:hypothetical protein
MTPQSSRCYPKLDKPDLEPTEKVTMTHHVRHPTVTVDQIRHDSIRGTVADVELTVDYAGGMVAISMPEFPAIPDVQLEREVRDRLTELADAIREAAHSPSGIVWPPSTTMGQSA